ncbi:MAG TPA: acyl-CoA dehydrogenase family protein [Acidimicrobiales bacterium]|nr:acyl-CoA dehydrogenase family protein [Acidimicrobiales bacterium]
MSGGLAGAPPGTEDVESFRRRARAWIRANLDPAPPGEAGIGRARSDERELARVARSREIQRALFDAGLAGICFPVEYGGQGLSLEHLSAFNQEVAGYDCAADLQIPTFTPCAAVILEFGTEEQKRAHLPAILRGEEMWMQFLSEPSGGSDVAGALTTAVRDGDEWVMNGSKIWTTGAWWADWGLCLARTNWDVPKHRGLTVFILRIHQPGVEVHRIEMLNGNREFCQEFITDVRIPDSDRVGDVDQGWTVGTRWMFHERTAMGGGSPYVVRPAGSGSAGLVGSGDSLWPLVVAEGRSQDPTALDLVGEAHTLALVGSALTPRIGASMRSGALNDQASAIARLYSGTRSVRYATIAYELAGQSGLAWDPEAGDPGPGVGYLMRQAACIGGGTTEMARNVISERVLGMPREVSHDRDTPFRDVPRGPAAG